MSANSLRRDSRSGSASRLRARSPRTHDGRLLGICSVLGTVLVLELLTRSEVVRSSVLPPPSLIMIDVGRWLVSAENWLRVLQTVQGVVIGLGAAALVGATLGIILGAVPLLERLTAGILEFLRPIPSIALIPLAVLVLGVGMDTKYVLVFIGSLWPILIHTSLGVRSIDTVASDTCRSYGMTRLTRLRHLVLPTALPQILTGVRISIAIALIVAITVELIVGVPGLGLTVNLAQQSGDTVRMWAGILIIGVLGTALNAGLVRVERRVLHWHSSQRSESF